MDDERTIDQPPSEESETEEVSSRPEEAPSSTDQPVQGLWRLAVRPVRRAFAATRRALAARRKAPPAEPVPAVTEAAPPAPIEAETEIALPAPKPRTVLHRRAFILAGFWGSLAALATAIVGGLHLDFLWPRKVTGFGAAVDVSATKIPNPGEDPMRVPEGRFWLAHLAPGDAGSPGGLLALYQKCPHLGCTVPWRADFEFAGKKGWYRCPCHGSTFTKEGGVLVFGPSPRSMDTMSLEIKPTGDVVVNTGEISEGGEDNPQRAVPYELPSEELPAEEIGPPKPTVTPEGGPSAAPGADSAGQGEQST